jgi:hypothetical protein
MTEESPKPRWKTPTVPTEERRRKIIPQASGSATAAFCKTCGDAHAASSPIPGQINAKSA